MPTDPPRKRDVEPLAPEDVDSAPSRKEASAADQVPVPPVMSPAEVDERAKVIERLEDEEPTP